MDVLQFGHKTDFILFFKHLCDNNAHHMLAYIMSNKFDASGRNYKTWTGYLWRFT